MKTRTFTTLDLLVVLALIAPGGTQPPAVQAQSNDSNIVYVCNTGNIGRTGDISVTNHIWLNITPPTVGTINDCVPDPWSPTATMWVVGSSGIWIGDNLNTATPLWTLLQTTDQIRSATDGFTQNGSEPDRIIPSASISGTVFVLYSHGGLGSAPNTWVGRSTDNGATWSWTRVANEGEQARDFGFAITQNAVSPDNVTVWASTRRDHLYKSTDGGKSFQRVLSLPSTTYYQLHAIYSPPLDNDGSILYVGGGSSSGATSFISKTVDGGMTWATISPVGADSAPRGPLRQYEIAGAAGSISHLYALVQRAQDVVNERKKLYYSSDGGASWSLRQDFASRTDEVLGIGVNATDENRLYVLKDSSSAAATDLIFLSDDGGVTWQDRSGNWRAGVGLWRNAVAVWDASAKPIPLVDLSIDSVEPVQVLEGQPLVRDKATTVKVVIRKTGSGAANNVSVRLTYGSSVYTSFYVLDWPNLDDQYALRYDNTRYPLDIAAGEIGRTIYFIPDGLAPTGSAFEASVTVDYLGAIVESDEANNALSISTPVYDAQWGSLVPTNLKLHYFRANRGILPERGTIPDQDYYSYTLSANEFIGDVYPVSAARFTPNVSAYVAPGWQLFPNCDSPLCMLNFLRWMYEVYLRMRLSSPTADRYVMMVPDGWICEKVPTWCAIGIVVPLPGLDEIAIVEPRLTPLARLPGGASAAIAAHELGHTYGLPYPQLTYTPPCKEEYEDCNLTRSPDGIGDYASAGLWVDKRILIQTPAVRKVYSFMAVYTETVKYWVDTYDYTKLLSCAAGLPTCPDLNNNQANATLDAVTPTATTQAILAAGIFEITGTVTLDDWYVLPEAELSTLTPGPYTFEYQDASGGVIYQQSFDISYTLWGSTLPQVPFAFTIPYVAGTTKIVVKYTTTTLAEKVVTENAPTVTVITPNGGERLSGPTTIQWSGSDADGDGLTYAVLLSLDNGAIWEPLAANLATPSYLWDTSQLPAGPQYLIKVIATDGINTGQDVSNAPFTMLGQVYLPLIMR